MFLQNIFLPAMPCVQRQCKKTNKQKNTLSWKKEEVSWSEPISTGMADVQLTFFVCRHVRNLARPGWALATKGCTSHIEELCNIPAFSEQEEVKTYLTPKPFF